jgi:hypothetical protein
VSGMAPTMHSASCSVTHAPLPAATPCTPMHACPAPHWPAAPGRLQVLMQAGLPRVAQMVLAPAHSVPAVQPP